MTEFERDERFHAALEECSRRVTQGQPLESCLPDYPPSYHRALRELVPLSCRLDVLATDPSPAFEGALERRLRTEVVEPQAGPFLRRVIRLLKGPRQFSLRWGIVVAVVALLLAGGSVGAVQAAEGSLPDSQLYAVKALRERIELALLYNEDQRIEAYVRQLATRGNELDQAVRLSKPRVVRQVSLRLLQTVGEAVDRAIAAAARGNVRPATRARVFLRALDVRLEALETSAPLAYRPEIVVLRRRLQAEVERLRDAVSAQ